MNDNEIHFYGDKHHFDKRWLLLIPAIIIVAALVLICYRNVHKGGPVAKENPKEFADKVVRNNKLIDTLITSGRNGTLVILDTTINDKQITILIPLNSRPQLRRGYETIQDTADILLCLAAADAGKHDKVIGSFVFEGELLNKGLSKKGYCAIIHDTVTLGMSESSQPQNQKKSIRERGYFFRQRALVDSGRIVDNELRGEFFCRALCQKNSCNCIVICREKCSLHDFSQLLIDIGITQAIALQSAPNAKGWYHTQEGDIKFLGDWSSCKYPNAANYIVWLL